MIGQEPYQTYTTADDCYLNLGTSSIITEWFGNTIDTMSFDLGTHGWDAELCPVTVWQQVPILNQIHNQFAIKHAGILRLKPYRCYDWHVDQYRGVTVNCLLTPSIKTHCVFGKPDGNEHFDFLELTYQPNTLYLFNTQVPHMVMNWDETRYVFGVEFEQDKTELLYNDIKQWLAQ